MSTPVTEQSLLEAGYKKQIFFFQIGGGEDEDDRYIFVKDGIAVTHEYTQDRWYAKKYDDISYENGIDTDNATLVKYIEDLKLL